MKTATSTLDYEASSYAASADTGIGKTLAGFGKTLRAWRERSRTRHALAELSPHLLQDIGIEPDAALKEAARPFWKA